MKAILWENRKQILEGLKNKMFKTQFVEGVFETRIKVCKECALYDESGVGCYVKGTHPCCNNKLEGCGCSLSIKLRSLSSECPFKYWNAVLTEEEEDSI